MRLNSMQKNAVNAFKYYEDMENAYFSVLVRIGKLFFNGIISKSKADELMRKYGNKYESYGERKELAIADLKRDGIIVHTSKVMNDFSKEVYETVERNLMVEIY
jgi:hypothetical protein|nr:MAG TPA: hypothetical protein [Caudoviricetes sp.]